VDGLAASAGSIIAMAGDEIRMADNAFLMIHNAWGGVMGEADDMRGYADMLEKLDDSIASTYQVRAGKTRAYWRKKMADESWFNAAEAKAEGLADTIEKPEKAVTNRFDFKAYNHVPGCRSAVVGETTRTTSAGGLDACRAAAGRHPRRPLGDGRQCHLRPRRRKALPRRATAPRRANPSTSARSPTPPTRSSTFRTSPARSSTTRATRRAWRKAYKAAHERLKAIVDVCPGRPAMALTAFLSGQTPEAVKLAVDEAARVENDAKVARAGACRSRSRGSTRC
jgi:hypothetical protein